MKKKTYESIYVTALLLFVGSFLCLAIWENLKWLWIVAGIMSVVLVWSIVNVGIKMSAEGKEMANTSSWQLKLILWLGPILIVFCVVEIIIGSPWNRVAFAFNMAFFPYVFATALAEALRRKKIRKHIQDKLKE